MCTESNKVHGRVSNKVNGCVLKVIGVGGHYFSNSSCISGRRRRRRPSSTSVTAILFW